MGLSPAAITDRPGYAARRIAADILDGVLRRRRPLDDQLDGRNAHPGLAGLEPRDRALVRRLVATALRRRGTLNRLLGLYLDRGMPAAAPAVETALTIGAVQILWLDVPDHAAVDLSVRLAQADRRSARYAALVNAVLRKVAQNGPARLAGLDAAWLDTPDWLLSRWRAAYGDAAARQVAHANSVEPALDISVKDEPARWAERLGGRIVMGRTVRLAAHGPVPQLSGYDDGEWWVQDVAASLPARLLGDINGRDVVDLCAAPGGKTAQLAAAGARVTAVDQSENRIARVRQNLDRLRLSAETVVADAATWQGGPFDAVLLDAPCSSTGTIRRHPDIAWLKTESDVQTLARVQRRLLAHAAMLLKPGGRLVYCVCSIEPDEGGDVVRSVLAADPTLARLPVESHEVDGHAELITAEGDLRTLPCHLPDSDWRMAGMDGFYAARLVRR